MNFVAGGFIMALNSLQTTRQYARGNVQFLKAFKENNGVYQEKICGSIASKFLHALCWLGSIFTWLIQKGWHLESLVALQIISLAYISMQQQKVNYSSKNYEILQKDGLWAYDALNIMNVK